jgi:Ricin-type beta-trefoil lectin domain-like
VQQWTCQDGGWKRWRLVNVGRNYYKLIGQNSGHCLHVAVGSSAPGPGKAGRLSYPVVC